jgi:hypothetical protein
LVGFAYWTLFDGLFNLFRRLPWNYVGVPDNWDAASDKLERIYPWFWKAKILIAVGLKICYIFFLISS